MFHASNIKLNFTLPAQFLVVFDDADLTIQAVPISGLEPVHECTCYVVNLKDKAGALLIQKCKDLKIPPGPLFAKLKNGEAIELPNGTLVQPEDVLGPPEVGSAFIIVECSSNDHVDALVSNESLVSCLNGKIPEFIVHITPESVISSQKYQSWMDTFNKSTKHIILNSSNQNEFSLLSSSLSQLKLNSIDPNIFKILQEKYVNDYSLDDQPRILRDSPTMLTHNLRGSKSIELKPEMFQIEKNKSKIEMELRGKVENCQQEYFRKTENCHAQSGFEPNVLFLGTASATPGVLRNTSSILLNCEPDKSVLFDCGEATFLQMNRFYGREVTNKILQSLGVVFISHNHADHHFGLIKLIEHRHKIFPDAEPLLVVAPEVIDSFLKGYSEIENDIVPLYRMLTCDQLLYEKEDTPDHVLQLKQEVLQRSSLEDLVTVYVPHCHDSYGIVVTFEGKKIAYSGDSMFSNAFDKAGKDCLLLIHEATMSDDLRKEAELKRHSTISDAINVGRNINAEYTILTHFSQRFAKVAPITTIEDESLKSYIDQHVGVAFDFMNVPLSQLFKIVKMKSVLEVLFAEDIQDIHHDQQKRANKRKLIEDIKKETINVAL